MSDAANEYATPSELFPNARTKNSAMRRASPVWISARDIKNATNTSQTDEFEYPDSASIESDFFALSQLLAFHAGKAVTDPVLRRELADAGVTRSELLLQAIRLHQTFLALSPKNPLADEASLALVGDFLELEVMLQGD